MSDASGSTHILTSTFTRRPAVVPAVALTIGILLHKQLPLNYCTELIATAILALIAALTIGKPIICSTFLLLLVLLLGVTLAQREHFTFSRNDIGLFATDEPHLTQMDARIIDDPQIVTGSTNAHRPMPPKQVFTADALTIQTCNGWVAVTGNIPVQMNQPEPGLQAGQTVRVLGMLQRPRSAMNPGEFDWAAYYRQQRVLATFTVNRIGNVKILQSPGASILTWLRIKTHHLLTRGFNASHVAEYAILDAMILGHRDPELRDIQQEFKQTGTAYQLSVSGLHIAILGSAVFWCCRCCRFRPGLTLWITTGFVLLYALVAMPSHSGIRGCIVCVVLVISFISLRTTARPQLIAMAVLLMLAGHPLDLYSVGFHLSFAVAIAFIFLHPPLHAWVEQFRDPDEVAKPRSAGLSLWKRFSRYISWCLQAGLIAWAAILPLAAYHFGEVSSWSTLGGLILLPFALLALFTGVLKIFFTLLWPRAASLWALVAGGPVVAMQWGVHVLAKLPGSSIPLPTPPICLIVIFYLLLLAPLLPYWSWTTGRRRWVIRLAPAIGIAAILSLPVWLRSPSTAVDQLKVTLLSVGAGQCAVVELPGGHALLVDAGSTTVSDVAVKIVEPFLRNERQSYVDEIFLSHGDFDHISAAGEIASSYAIQQVFTSYHFEKNAVGNTPDLELLETLSKLNRAPTKLKTGDHFDLPGGASMEVLWPPATGELNSNNAGLVLRLSFAGRSILFPADIQDPAFIGVLKNAKALKSDVLIAPHHGSVEQLTSAFLSAVHPQMILSSNAARLSGKQKRFQIITNHIPLYRTPDFGAISLMISKDGSMVVKSFKTGPRPHQ